MLQQPETFATIGHMLNHEKAMRSYMRENGLTQEQLANKGKWHVSQVSKWLNGVTPSVSRLRDISRKLGINIAELL